MPVPSLRVLLLRLCLDWTVTLVTIPHFFNWQRPRCLSSCAVLNIANSFALLRCTIYLTVCPLSRLRNLRSVMESRYNTTPLYAHQFWRFATTDETSPLRGRSSPVRCLDRRPQAQGAPTPTARPRWSGRTARSLWSCDWQVNKILVWSNGLCVASSGGVWQRIY